MIPNPLDRSLTVRGNHEVVAPDCLDGAVPALELTKYLERVNNTRSFHLDLLTQLCSKKGVGIRIPGDDKILYYYGRLESHHVFSLGGRSFLYMSKSLLRLSPAISKMIKERFMEIDDSTDSSMSQHMSYLRKEIFSLNSIRDPFIQDITTTGRLTVYAKNLSTPFVEIGTISPARLVVPFEWITAASKGGCVPDRVINYSGQKVLCCRTEDDMLVLLYVANKLDDTLFQQDL